MEVYEEQEVSSELEPELISPEEQDELLDRNRQRKWGRRGEQENIPGIKSYSRSKQLYLSPELSREDLAQIVHLNNARFARMIRECTGTNFNGYINGLRINYAIKLMKNILTIPYVPSLMNPDLIVPRYYITFLRKKTGMTPYEFKKRRTH